jgi:hypothetical protein
MNNFGPGLGVRGRGGWKQRIEARGDGHFGQSLLLLAMVLLAWALGAYLRWRHLRRREKVPANLERLRWRVSRKVACEKAPCLESQRPQPEERIKQLTLPLAG